MPVVGFPISAEFGVEIVRRVKLNAGSRRQHLHYTSGLGIFDLRDAPRLFGHEIGEGVTVIITAAINLFDPRSNGRWRPKIKGRALDRKEVAGGDFP